MGLPEDLHLRMKAHFYDQGSNISAWQGTDSLSFPNSRAQIRRDCGKMHMARHHVVAKDASTLLHREHKRVCHPT
jgi:hypothetical protein